MGFCGSCPQPSINEQGNGGAAPHLFYETQTPIYGHISIQLKEQKKIIREIGVYMENVTFIGAAPAPPPCFQLQLPNGGTLSPLPI